MSEVMFHTQSHGSSLERESKHVVYLCNSLFHGLFNVDVIFCFVIFNSGRGYLLLFPRMYRQVPTHMGMKMDTMMPYN